MYAIAWISIGLAAGCAVLIAADEMRRPQKMAIMNVVWPISALYFSVFGLWAYVKLGRPGERGSERQQGGWNRSGESAHEGKSPKSPGFGQIAKATSHCGAGCTLADLACDFFIAAAGIELLGSSLWAEYAIDLAGAWLLGIVFQYFSIKPMRDISAGQAIVAAMKADTLSIIAFQVGMYAWMALTYFVLFPHPHLTAFDPRYWLMMQIAMICGFATSFPMNRLLLRMGWKEAM